ncbi:single-stranded DNA-binding protein [Spiroplasma endosymbiont of Othius punctulatus]|uniref:single-stranded DNA-binding protein n=1 Tax=Spiroplasma endosymbiont of Othius punctulatus TaxID=3066289 RepID=UPI0030D1DBEC
MNNVTLIGQLVNVPELIFEKDGDEKRLYKLTLRVERPFKSKTTSIEADFINIKVWANVLGDESEYFEDSLLSVEGRIVSYMSKDKTQYINEMIASKVINYN